MQGFLWVFKLTTIFNTFHFILTDPETPNTNMAPEFKRSFQSKMNATVGIEKNLICGAIG